MPKNTTFEEKEMEILHNAVNIAESKLGKKIKQSNDILNIIKILEDFMRRKKVVCYGGTAINNILPITDQFYDKDVEIPDYDFFTPRQDTDINMLVRDLTRAGFTEISVREGVHEGTIKIYVDYILVIHTY